jgi:PhnB protein
MITSPHLHFQGNCGEAFRFYADTFGGKITFAITYGESPVAAQMPAELKNRIMHARLELGGQYLLGCDVPTERFRSPQGFNVVAAVADPADAERAFEALAADGIVTMPMQETFWAQRFGMCTDRFGIPWMVNCEKGP